MTFLVEHVDTWSATIPDHAGALAAVLATLRDARANLQSVIVRRTHDGEAVVFVTPLETDREIAAASQVGFNVAHKLHSVRVMGRDRPGIAAELTDAVARAGIDLRGFNAAVIGTQFVAYFGVDSREQAERLVNVVSRSALEQAA